MSTKKIVSLFRWKIFCLLITFVSTFGVCYVSQGGTATLLSSYPPDTAKGSPSPAAPVTKDCRSGAELAAAFANPDVHIARVLVNILLLDSDWEPFTLPVMLRRNVTVTGPYNNLALYPVLDLNFLRGKVALAENVQLSFSRVVMKGYRKLPMFQSPGFDLVYTGVDGVQQSLQSSATLISEDKQSGSSGNTSSNNSALKSVETKAAIIEHAAMIHRLCIPPADTERSVSTALRPPGDTGRQQAVARVAPPLSEPCINDTARSDLRRCWPAIGMYIDLAAVGLDLNSYGRTVQTGYVVRVLDTYFMCEIVMTEECIKRYDLLGCYKSIISTKPPAVDSLEPSSSSSSSSESSPMSANGGNMFRGGSLAASDGGSASTVGGGGGGSSRGGRSNSRRLAIVLPSVLLGLLALAIVAGLGSWMATKWSRSRKNKNSCHECGNNGDGSGVVTASKRTPPPTPPLQGTAAMIGSSNPESNTKYITLQDDSKSGDFKSDHDNNAADSCSINKDIGTEGEMMSAVMTTMAPQPTGGLLAPGVRQQVEVYNKDLPQGMVELMLKGKGDGANRDLDRRSAPLESAAGAPAAAAATTTTTAAAAETATEPLRCLTDEVVLAPVTAQTPFLSVVRFCIKVILNGGMETKAQPKLAVADGRSCVQHIGGVGAGAGGGNGVGDNGGNVGDSATNYAGNESNNAVKLTISGINDDCYNEPAATGQPAAAAADEVYLLRNETLGVGAYGRVVVGLYGGQRVAVKLLNTGLMSKPAVGVGNAFMNCAAAVNNNDLQLYTTAAALIQEVEVLARCQHPNIVRLLATSLGPRQQFCLVMELMDTSLEKLMYNKYTESRMPLPVVIHIGIQIARALSYLHPTIMHRDLKPANVLISNPDSPKPLAKLADFGLSRLLNSVLITRNAEVGTPQYMAPETFDLKQLVITDRADIYSLGVILWEMLAGVRPWADVSMFQIAICITMLQMRLPLDLIPAERCPPKLRALLRSCWDSDPARRPAAAEVVKTLVLVQEVL